ncbi:MAG: hypothetical protein GEV09_21140 [Pseudonocardiaceae bacterium]|nr:hypothetical protein [Pseudonocardiaceae bacterium]
MSEPVEPTAEADDYDAIEQQRPVEYEPGGSRSSAAVGLEVPDADAAEQAAEVPVDDDDYPA